MEERSLARTGALEADGSEGSRISRVDGIVMGFLEAGSGAELDLSCATEFERPPFKLPG